MRLFHPESLIDGTLNDPSSRYICHVFSAPLAVGAEVAADAAIPAAIGAADIGAAVAPEVAGATLGGFSSLAGPEIAGLTAADIGGGALAADIGGVAAGVGGLEEALGGIGAGIEGAGSGLTGVGGALAPISAGADVAAPTAALPAATAGTAVGGPAAAAPALPASVGAAPGTVTGDLAGVADTGYGGDFGGGEAAGGATSGSGSTAAAGTGAKGGFFDRAVSSLTGGALNKSDLGTILSGGGLLMNLMKGNQSLPGEKQLSGAASNLSATAAGQAALGTQLEGFLQSGKLPPGVESGLRSATNAVHAKIKSNYAARGMSGSSAEAQDIQAANDRAFEAGQQVAMQLLQQGSTLVGQAVGTEGLAASLYEQILANSLQKDKDFGQALGNFSSALARSDQPTSITLKTAA